MNQSSQNQPGTGFTTLGKLVSLLLILGLIGVGAYVVLKKSNPQGGATGGTAKDTKSGTLTSKDGAVRAKDGAATKPAASLDDLKVTEAQPSVPTLSPPLAYTPKDNIVEIELSEYAGYSGLIAANGGLAPNDDSYFAKKHGFKVKLTLSEEESWSALNSGRMGASATTVDVLAVYGKQFQVVVPAQIGFSRGADAIVVRQDIKRINNLKGQVVAASQFTESEFFLRFLAQEAGIGVKVLDELSAGPDPDKINLVFAADAFEACDIFAEELGEGQGRVAACVTWEPKTSETVAASKGEARILTTNRNLLIVADVLIVNKGFAQANPKMVGGLVDGLLYGNKLVRTNPESQLGVIGKAFGWDQAKTRTELTKVHLSNLPENMAFFSGAIDMAGSFGGIYQSAVYAYGKEYIKDPPAAERFLDLSSLQLIAATGIYKDEKIEIQPIKLSVTGSIETDPLLSKDIRFLFLPNSDKLDMNNPDNIQRLESIRALLQVSPGSTVLLRGHVDDAMIGDFRKQGGESFVRQMAMKAAELSKNRAAEIKKLMIERHKVEPMRIETVGRGWDEPSGKDSEQNRRVEVQWFTVE